MTGKHQPITGLMGLISVPLQFLFAAPNIPLKYQTDPAVASSTLQTFRVPSSGSLSIRCCSGTCPELVPPFSWGTLKVPVKKLLPLQGEERKSLPQTQQIWL